MNSFSSLRQSHASLASIRGFTLIEVMITVALLALLAAIGYPQYTNHVATGYITEAHADLMDYKNKMESYYQDEKTYRTGTGSACGVQPGAYNTTGKKFAYGCTAADETFTLTATSSLPLLSGMGFSINNNGAKQTFKQTTATITQATCWAKHRGGAC